MTQNIEQRTEVAVKRYEGSAATVEKIAHTDADIETGAGKRKSFPKISREWDGESQRLQKEWQNDSAVIREDWQTERNELSTKALGVKPWEAGQQETNINQQRRWTDNHTYLPKSVPALMGAGGPDDYWIPYTADKSDTLKDVFGRKPLDLIVGLAIVPDITFQYPKLAAFGKIWELPDGDTQLTVKSFAETSGIYLVLTLDDDSHVVAHKMAGASRTYASESANSAIRQTTRLNIYPADANKYAKVGDTVPSGTEAIRLESSGTVYVLDGKVTVAAILESIDFSAGTVTIGGDAIQAIPITTENSIRIYRFGNDADAIQAAVKSAYRRREIQFLIFEQAEYELDKAVFFNSYPEDGYLDRSFTIIANGTTFKLTQATNGGAVLNFGRGADVGSAGAVERTGHLTWFGGIVDGNSIAGENGWAFERAENITMHNIKAVNCKRDYVGTREGGRGLTGHDRCRNVNIYGYTAVNCSDYYHLAHNNDHRVEDSGNVAITSISKAINAVVTAPGHQFQPGMTAAIYNCKGMTEINPSYHSDAFYRVVSVDGDKFTIDCDSRNFGEYQDSGRTVIADMTDAGRSPGVNIYGGYAEDCEYSLINIEGANQPRTMRFIQAVNVLGVVAKNCATVTTRGLVNGSNAIRLNADITSYNEFGRALQSLVRGSFQGSTIKIVADVTDIKSYIDARPTEENPAGSGIDKGYASHPYGTSCDNKYELLVKYRNTVQSGVVAYIRVDEHLSGSVKQYYRNHADITVTGLPDAQGAGSDFSNAPLHYTNTVLIKDSNLGRVYEGSLTKVRKFSGNANTVCHGGYEHSFDQQINVSDAGVDFVRYGFKDTAGVVQGSMEYKLSLNRMYFRIDANASAYQMTSLAFFPSTPNNKDCGTAGLPFRNFFGQNSAIQASDKRLKNVEQLTDETKAKFWRAFEKGISQVDWFWKWKDRDPEDARIHCAPLAQDFFQCFEDEGLNPFDFAFACYDSWDDIYDDVPQYDEQGQVLGVEKVLIKPAGDQYSIRMNEIMALFIQYQVWLMKIKDA